MKHNTKLSLEVEDQIKLGNFLIEKLGLEESKADTLSHSLTDISKSWNKIYGVMIPKLFQLTDKESIVDLFLEIREEFRHVDYHIKDADLDELNYIQY